MTNFNQLSCAGLNHCAVFSLETEKKPEQEAKSNKAKSGATAKGVNLERDVSLASSNPNARGPVNRQPGTRGAAPMPGPGPGRGRGRGHPPR